MSNRDNDRRREKRKKELWPKRALPTYVRLSVLCFFDSRAFIVIVGPYRRQVDVFRSRLYTKIRKPVSVFREIELSSDVWEVLYVREFNVEVARLL